MKKDIPKVNRKTAVNTPKQKSNKLDFQKWISPLNLLFLLLFIVVAYYLLVITNRFVLSRIQEFSLFLPTQYFLIEHFKSPGALLTYLSSFLIQFFYYPWLGATLFIIMALLVQFLFIKAYDIQRHFYSFTFVIPFVLLLTITQLGYMIFAVKLNYFIYTLSIGLSFGFVMLWLYNLVSSVIVRTVILAFTVLLSYPLVGFYALFTALLFMLVEFRLLIKTKKIIQLLPIVIGIVFCSVIPYLLYVYYYTQIDYTQIYSIGLPQLYDSEQFYWIPFIVIGFLTLGWHLSSYFRFNAETSLLSILSGLSVYLVSLYGLFHFSYTDPNFQAELAMENAVSNNRWEDVLTQAKELKEEPTRLLVMYPRLALQKLNRGGDELFDFPNGNKGTNSPWPTELLATSGKQFFYQYGKLNYSYQAAFDDMVERGMKVDDLNYLVKNALLNKELQLAQKYNNILAGTFFYRDKAIKYQQFIDHPTLMGQDAEFSTILPLTKYVNEVFDAGVLETYLLQDFARNRGTTPQYAEIAIQNALILRNSNLFWYHFLPYAQLVTRIPRHYQEAAVLFAFYEGNVDTQTLNLDPAIIAEFHEFEHFLDQNRANTKEMNKNLLHPTFGNTFWFYFFFSEPIVSS